MQEFITIANSLADAAGEIVREHFRTAFYVIAKEDDSPVTIADRAIETRMREMLEDLRPEDGILGEEFGIKESRSGLTWVLDPIDGTKSFVIGRPTFGTLIALAEEDAPVLGVIDQGVSGERWVGVRGQATLFNGETVRVRDCGDLAQACVASTTPAMFSDTKPVYEAFEDQCRMMAWGGDCYMYGLLANGHMDICVEAALSPYDFAALVPVVQGAGGVMSDWDGADLTLKSDGRVVASGSRVLHEEALRLIRDF